MDGMVDIDCGLSPYASLSEEACHRLAHAIGCAL